MKNTATIYEPGGKPLKRGLDNFVAEQQAKELAAEKNADVVLETPDDLWLVHPDSSKDPTTYEELGWSSNDVTYERG